MHIVDFILCDDIRQEVGNKFSLMGIFGDRVTINVLDAVPASEPATMRLGIYMRAALEAEDPVASEFELTVRQATGKPISVVQPLVISKELTTKPRYVNVYLTSAQFPIFGSGQVSFDVAIKSGGREIRCNSQRHPCMDVQFVINRVKQERPTEDVTAAS